MRDNLKTFLICGFAIGFILIISCKESNESDNGTVSFGVNTHLINCIANGEVFIDGKSIGIIPGCCDSIFDCTSTNTLNRTISMGNHSYFIEVEGQSGSCLREKAGDFNVLKGECIKIFMDLTKLGD